MPAGIFIRPFLLLFGVAWLATVRGAELTDVQLRDGLTKLVAYMGEDVPRDARWVQVESSGQRFGIFTQDADVFNSVGNAFLFGEKPGVEARIVILFRGDIFPIKAESDEIRSREDAREYRGQWKEAEVAKDVDKAVEWLRREAAKLKKMNPSDPFGPSGNDDPDNSAVFFGQHQQTALFWAAMLLHTGHEKEALPLARQVFGDADATRRQQLLDGLFGRFAQNGWRQAMKEFSQHSDWGRLRDQLAALVKKFPAGWSRRDAVRVFLQAVTERAKLPADPPLKTKLPLPAADQESLRTWLKEQESGKFSGYSRWTLPALPDAADGPGIAMGYTAFPRSHGLAAVPLLAALLADDTLTMVGAGAVDRGTENLNPWDNMDSFGRETDAAQKLRVEYRNLPKPSTRADLAWQSLQRVIPNELRSGGETDLADRASDILAWYGTVKDLAPPDLALKYMEGGLNDADILAHAFATTDEKKIARLENVMIEQVQVYDLRSLDPFVIKLGAKAPDFLVKVRQKLEDELTRYGDEQDKPRKQMETGLKRLDTLAKGELKKPDLPTLIAMIAAFDPDLPEQDQEVDRDAFEELPKLFKTLTLQAKLEAIVPALLDFKSPRMAEYMMQFVFAEEDGSKVKLKPEEGLAVLEKTKSHWKRLLERTDPGQVPSDPDGEDLPQGLLIRTVSCLQLLVTGEADDASANYLAALGARGTRVLHDYGMALLDGKTPAPLPNVAAINPEMRQQFLKDWGGKSAEEIARGVETMEIDKLIILNEALTQEAELPPNLMAYRDQIHEVTLSGVKEVGVWQAWRGHLLDKATAIEIARRVSAFEGSSIVSVQLQRQAPVMGWKLIVKESSSLPTGWEGENLRSTALGIGEALPKLAKRASQGAFTSGDHQLIWHWFNAPVTEAPKEEVSTEVKQADEALAEAWAYMGEARREELRGWEFVSKVLVQQKAKPFNLHFISISTTGIPKTE
ncbi:hypothetical protein BH11VER1_BH11VER1_02180 [soil metagenome]